MPLPSPDSPALVPLSGPALAVHRVLPQTQCQRCGYPDCAGYAQAVVDGSADINQCPPGGEDGIRRIAQALGQPQRAEGMTLNAEFGQEGPMTVAVIDENWCIGCTLCIKACPTDAILGANKRMHTILADACTGCELCLPVCPVDCIELDNASGTATGWAAWSPAQAEQARERYQKRSKRLAAGHDLPAKKPQTPAASKPAAASPMPSKVTASAPAPAADDKKATIAAILAKARQQRAGGR